MPAERNDSASEANYTLATVPGLSSFRGYILLSVIVFGFFLLIGLDIFFRSLIDDLNRQTEDEQARLLIGEMIINDLVRIESDVYKMATTTGVRGQELVKQSVLDNLNQLDISLNVLEHGGTLRKATRVNIESSEEIVRTVTYHGFNRQEYILEVIDLRPKINHIKAQVEELANLLAQRDQTLETGNADELALVMRNTKNFIRKIPPHFTRMNENAARLFVYSQNQKLRLDEKIAVRKKYYNSIELTIASFIIIAVTAFGYILLNQISKSNLQLHDATKTMIAATRAAEAASRAKSEFLSSMSHELRTPLNAILGFAQLMALEVKTDSEQENVSEILKAGRHLLQLINEVLDLSRIETGRIQLSIEPVQLNGLISECMSLSAPIAVRYDVRLTTDDIDDDIFISADRTRIKQILLNLISNAVKYNKSGGLVSLSATHDSDNTLLIAVTDTGRGIAEESRHQLFEPFNRLGAEETTIEGTGIGLAISKKLTELMHGEIGYEPTESGGSRFWIRLPQARISTQYSTNAGNESRSGPCLDASDAPHATILYIEDNPANLRLVGQLLSRRPGITLLTAHEPLLGLELAMSNPVDLILLDINLPSLDGYQVLERIRSQQRTRDIPVIAVTANAMPSDREKGLAAGFNSYLTKPLDIKEFYRVVDEYAEHRHG